MLSKISTVYASYIIQWLMSYGARLLKKLRKLNTGFFRPKKSISFYALNIPIFTQAHQLSYLMYFFLNFHMYISVTYNNTPRI